MGRGAHSTQAEKDFILSLKNNGKSMCEIAKILKCSKNKAFNAIHAKKDMKLEEENEKHQQDWTDPL